MDSWFSFSSLKYVTLRRQGENVQYIIIVKEISGNKVCYCNNIGEVDQEIKIFTPDERARARIFTVINELQIKEHENPSTLLHNPELKREATLGAYVDSIIFVLKSEKVEFDEEKVKSTLSKFKDPEFLLNLNHSIAKFLAKQISLQRAAEIANMQLNEYKDILKRLSIPWGEYDEEEFRQDIDTLKKYTES
ncbi:UPF0175 family protein [Priestia aryabhattai]